MAEGEQHIFWLNGLAGTGKSTIAQTFAEMAFADGRLGASFFCSRDFEDRSNLQTIFPTLAFQLAYQYPLFRGELLQALKAHPDVGQESLCLQMERLIVGPLKATSIQTLIIIDALDECKDEEPASAILSILSHYMDEIPNVKFFITGRPEPRIRSGFRLRSLLPITEVLKLHEVKPETVNDDIKLFFQIQFTDLTENRSDCDTMGDWPSSSDIEILCKKAAGFFIYASTVVKFVASTTHPPTERLTLITSLPQHTTEEGRSGIDQLYIQVLEHAFHNVHADDTQLYSCLCSILGTVLLIFNPLSIKGLSELLKRHHKPSYILSTMRSLHSLLLVPDSMEDPILTFHKSFPDFLTDPKRCEDKRFFVEPVVHHVDILLSCLDLMQERLEKNICRIDDYTILSEVEDLSNRQKEYIGDALEYACHFWTKHLTKVPGSSPDVREVQKAIDKFFTTHLLFWIEVLILMGNLGVGVYALNDIQQWYMLVSRMYTAYSENHCSYLLRQEFPASGSMTASVSSWNTLIQSVTLLLRYTILLSHFHPPCLGSTSVTVWSSWERSRWSKEFQLNGECVSAQLRLMRLSGPLHIGKELLQLVYYLGTSSHLMEPQEARQPFCLVTLVWWDLSPSHQMGHHLYLGVVIIPSSSGMCKLVEL